jgi:nicotinate-nucleotide pyrophosphorylase
MSIQRVRTLRDLGADVISIGALTHSAEAADISLKLRPVEDGAPLLVPAT